MGTVGLSSFATLDEVDAFVTDAGLTPGAREEIAEHLPGLVVAGEAREPHESREAHGSREAAGEAVSPG